MKTLYESILASSNSGIQAFNVRPYGIGGTTWRVKAPMKEWFECVSIDNFLWASEISINVAKNYAKSKDGNKEFFVGLLFNDGYFEFKIVVQSEYSNFAIYYYFYFANEKKNYIEATEARFHQMNIIDKVDRTRKNDLNKRDSNKAAAQKMLDYVRRHLNIIEKQ